MNQISVPKSSTVPLRLSHLFQLPSSKEEISSAYVLYVIASVLILKYLVGNDCVFSQAVL